MSDIMDVAPITDVPALADDQLLAIADQAEKRIEAVKKILFVNHSQFNSHAHSPCFFAFLISL